MSRVLPLAEVFREAFAQEAAGNDPQALVLYERILAAIPNHPGALLRIAEIDMRRGDRATARSRLTRALESANAMHLPSTDLLTALARVERLDGRAVQARAAVERALLESPADPRAMLELGVIAFESGEHDEAERQFHATAQRHPDLGIAWLQLALAREKRGDMAGARDAVANAMRARNTSAVVSENAVRLAWRNGDVEAAERLCRDALARYPGNPGLLHQKGIVQKLLGRTDAACAALREALALAPSDAGLHVSLAAALLDARRADDALRHLEQAIALGASGGEVWDNVGLARLAIGDSEGAQKAFEKAVALAPALTPALANLVHLRQQNCAWQGLARFEQTLSATLDAAASDPRWPPFIALAMDLTAQQQLAVARRWSRAMLPPVRRSARAKPRATRLRIGYLGNDFREHAMGRLMAGLFEAHDRSTFEIFAYSYGRDDGSALQARIRNGFDHWRELPQHSDDEIAESIRADGIDVIIECKGHTRGGRLGILASRPAPLQLHYMGFPGSLGYDAIDGIIADAEVIPPGDEANFHERVYRLPRCYFVNDAKRDMPRAQARSQHGLPERAIVLACFNQPYKITPGVFGIWMRALDASKDAVLWLLAMSQAQQRNLIEEAGRAGVAGERLIFAPPMTQDAHMARMGCADLTLDTVPVNQHTTACDALWAGVPMLTLRGSTFAGRVGASLLRAAGLDDLVTGSLANYEARLLELLRDPASLHAYRTHLTARRHSFALFDTAGFARDWEALILAAYEERKAALT